MKVITIIDPIQNPGFLLGNRYSCFKIKTNIVVINVKDCQYLLVISVITSWAPPKDVSSNFIIDEDEQRVWEGTKPPTWPKT